MRKLKLGLKTTIEPAQLFDRLNHKPDIIELHTTKETYDNSGLSNLTATVSYLKELGIEVIVHGPISLKGERISMIHKNRCLRDFYHESAKSLVELAKKEDVYIVLHPDYTDSRNYPKDQYIKEMNAYLDYYDDLSEKRILWENDTKNYFSYYNPAFFEDFQMKKRNMCFDTLHAFMNFKGDNNKLENAVKEANESIKRFHQRLGKEAQVF